MGEAQGVSEALVHRDISFIMSRSTLSFPFPFNLNMALRDPTYFVFWCLRVQLQAFAESDSSRGDVYLLLRGVLVGSVVLLNRGLSIRRWRKHWARL